MPITGRENTLDIPGTENPILFAQGTLTPALHGERCVGRSVIAAANFLPEKAE